MEHASASGTFQKIGSVVVAQDGHIVYEHYFAGDASTLRDTRSATKTITSMLVGIAIDRHKIPSVDTPVLTYFPGVTYANPDPRKAKITFQDLMTMSSVLECDDWNDASRGNEERMYVLEDWTQFVLDLPIRGWMRIPGDPPEKFPRHFEYCTAGAFLTGQALQHATGIPPDVYAQRYIFDPLNIHDAGWVRSPLGLIQTGGGLRLTSRDLLALAELYRNGGTYNGKRIVSEAWVRESTTPRAEADSDTDTAYGYFWWLRSFVAAGKPYPAWYMSGNGGNKVVIVPSLHLAIVITSTNYNTHGMHQQTDKLLTDYILPAFIH
jgi:CubicO group peptidase (beta-lactamase class C family)